MQLIPLRIFHLSTWLAVGLTHTHNAGLWAAVGCTHSHVCTWAMYAHVIRSSMLCELLLFSLKHGRTRQWTFSRKSRQRNLTWSQPPAQHVNACRVLREPAGTRGMQPESTRSHRATYDTATCPERACGFCKYEPACWANVSRDSFVKLSGCAPYRGSPRRL